MRLLSKLAVTTVAAASLLLGTAVVPASAATAPPINVTSIKVTPSNGSIATNSATKYYDVRTAVKVGDVSAWGEYWWADIYADVYRGSHRVASRVKLGVVASQNYKSLDGYIVAKNRWGRGDFKVKNIRALVDTYGTTAKDVLVRDGAYTGGAFKMRSAIDGKLKYHNAIRVTASGSHKTVKIGIRRYTPSGWNAYSYAKVKIQYKTSSGWKTRKTVTLNSEGLKTYKFTTSHRYKYRLSIAPTTKVAGGTTTPSSRI
ncbi:MULTISPECIES: hypothetical protein [unclassified Isoptericola]|uniref:hypothetical protein n=1 Tax=Isoptericola sp. NPDC057191 TaxID=3346041 RepID=UPI00364537B2